MNSISQVLSRMSFLESRFKKLFPSREAAASDAKTATIEKTEKSFSAQLQALQASSASLSNFQQPNGFSSSAIDPQTQSLSFANTAGLMSRNNRSTAQAAQMASLQNDKQQLDVQINSAATRFGIPPELLRSIAKVESNFDEMAVSSKGAMGIMQIMPETAKDLGLTSPFSAPDSLNAGAKLMRRLLDTYENDLVKALAAYNAGETVVNKKGVPNYPETQDYVRKVIKNYLKYSGVKQ